MKGGDPPDESPHPEQSEAGAYEGAGGYQKEKGVTEAGGALRGAVAAFPTCDWFSGSGQTPNLPGNSPERPKEGGGTSGKSAEQGPPPSLQLPGIAGRAPAIHHTPPSVSGLRLQPSVSTGLAQVPLPWSPRVSDPLRGSPKRGTHLMPSLYTKQRH